MLRYALLQIPNSVPHSALRLCFPSTSSLHSHSQPQSLDEAVDSFTRMLSMPRPPSIIQFTKILGSLAKTNHFPTAISLFQQLQARGIAPNLFTLNILINCCCGMGWITLAFSAFAKIFRSGFQPDTVTLTTIIKGLCLCGNADKALHFHDTVLAHGFQFNQVTYGTLINGLCKTGHTSAAIQVLRKIPRHGIVPNVFMYSAIIDRLCKVKLCPVSADKRSLRFPKVPKPKTQLRQWNCRRRPRLSASPRPPPSPIPNPYGQTFSSSSARRPFPGDFTVRGIQPLRCHVTVVSSSPRRCRHAANGRLVTLFSYFLLCSVSVF
ncbi:hypothetical protein Ahy_A05g022850 [Arachis hypogaea]|uniref:Pentatricopeptide repeat-containing protein n=1 Tax=Arachis hypogaea TaxID=3818 RepID=A0A445D1T8_ARAHY|nr:hypothetical protein Ahy_A05g022850 [Arachis hypogaea]